MLPEIARDVKGGLLLTRVEIPLARSAEQLGPNYASAHCFTTRCVTAPLYNRPSSGQFKFCPVSNINRDNKKTPPLAVKRNGGAGTEKRPE